MANSFYRVYIHIFSWWS